MSDTLRRLLAERTAAANAEVAGRLPFEDRADFDAATRGFLAPLPNGPIRTKDGGTAWNIADYDFLDETCPDSVNPSLWRMAQLNKIGGLFEVTPGVYQARAFDHANMTLIKGGKGWIVINPLTTVETAAAALKCANDTLGERPVVAVILSNIYPDVVAGLKGVADETTPIYAPADFMSHVASAELFGSNHALRRAIYQFGRILPTGPEGAVDGGHGKGLANGTRSFLPPTEFIATTGEERLIDGVTFVFQIASGGASPAQLTFHLPQSKTFFTSDICSHALHYTTAPRGMFSRDQLKWARVIDEATTRFGNDTEALITTYGWPVWGGDAIRAFLEEQRDILKYTHDQTLRLASMGHTPDEIAALIKEPDWLQESYHARGYYGTLKANAHAIYTRHFGAFDGNPVNLDPLPPAEHGKRFVVALGGAEAALAVAEKAVEDDDLQWATIILNHIVFASEATDTARALLADVYRHLGYRSESAVARNFYLTGAREMAQGITPTKVATQNDDLAEQINVEAWFDAHAIRLNPDRARGVKLALNFTVDGTPVALDLERQVEFARIGATHKRPDATLVISQRRLKRLSLGELQLDQAIADGAALTGQKEALETWLSLHDTFDLWFNIVTP